MKAPGLGWIAGILVRMHLVFEINAFYSPKHYLFSVSRLNSWQSDVFVSLSISVSICFVLRILVDEYVHYVHTRT